MLISKIVVPLQQAAVRELLRRMNIEVVEMAETLTIFLLLLATVLFRYI